MFLALWQGRRDGVAGGGGERGSLVVNRQVRFSVNCSYFVLAGPHMQAPRRSSFSDKQELCTLSLPRFIWAPPTLVYNIPPRLCSFLSVLWGVA